MSNLGTGKQKKIFSNCGILGAAAQGGCLTSTTRREQSWLDTIDGGHDGSLIEIAPLPGPLHDLRPPHKERQAHAQVACPYESSPLR